MVCCIPLGAFNHKVKNVMNFHLNFPKYISLGVVIVLPVNVTSATIV